MRLEQPAGNVGERRYLIVLEPEDMRKVDFSETTQWEGEFNPGDGISLDATIDHGGWEASQDLPVESISVLLMRLAYQAAYLESINGS